jgi:cardiolipin synthase
VALSILQLVPIWVAIIILSRDITIVAGTLLLYLTHTPIEVAPTVLGKGTTLAQLLYLALVLLLLYLDRDVSLLTPLLIVMLVLTVASGLQYVYRGIRAYRPRLV